MTADSAHYPRRRDLRPGDVATQDRRAPRQRSGREVRSAVPLDQASLADVVQDPGPQGPERGRRPQRDAGGRHANGVGDGFPRLMALTVVGAVLPGTGLVLAGRRRSGWALITLIVLAVAGAAALVVTGRALPLALRVGTDPRVLLGAAIGIVVLALVWCAVIVGSHLALRRGELTAGQRVLAVVLVAALMGIVSLPAATATRYVVAQRSLLAEVFGDDGGDRSGLADPDVAAADPWATTPRVNVLLLGSDAGADRTGIRPDTIFVASIDTKTGETVLFNLPRNLRFAPFAPGSDGAREHPDGYSCGDSATSDECILNAVWQWGEQHPEAYPSSAEPGLAAMREVVGQVLGLVVDYDVVLNLQGFEEVVDAMGGLRMDVERDIPIGGGDIIRNGRTVGEYPITGYVEAGEDQLLSGFEALWYARSRTGSDDYDRMRRQRCTVGAAVEQFDVPALAAAFPALAASAERNVETDIPAKQLPAFAELGLRVQGAPLRSLAFTNDVVDTADPDYVEIRALVQQALLPPAPEPSPTASAPPSDPATATPPPSASTTPPPAPAPGEAVDTADAC
ncbi:MAG: hypothetical protein AVDCRST_MAG35-191 [uncultured Quadrisphaera sp.]|uniref:Cell envelope-related transcriptional attenuator domain-containing protein n=1 Tax=uncultured Quadrisphaera sp. TaxID=904978 RepID=A0A6J4NN67_9ACTN|nr:MAG: hypothetical protein AVDCRST_MAG35-191 [uncultured Quadrisphaera sp.]